MSRISSLVLGIALIVLHSVALCSAAENDARHYVLKPGPYLFVDNFLIESSSGVERHVVQPQRFLDGPVVTSGPEHRNWQPWLTVVHDPSRPADRRFRMWYSADVDTDQTDDVYETRISYLESADGIRWPGPYQPLDELDSPLFGSSVVDEGSQAAVVAERFKLIYWPIPTAVRNGPVVAFSPDGIAWTMSNGGRSILTATPGGDSWHAAFDPLRSRYFLIGKTNEIHHWTNAEGQALSKRLRLFGTSTSSDFKTWSEMKLLFKPDEKDPGITEWYAVVGFQVRGDLIVAFLQALRDDLTCAGAPSEAIAENVKLKRSGAGMGHTVLCWTRDGETWHRDRQVDAFFEPDPTVGAWDHAMAWVAGAVPVGDELYLYYGGYRWGHKYRRSLDRQIGLVKMPRDRYVARHVGDSPGTLVTRPMVVAADGLSLNVDAADGEVRVRVLDADARPISGFDYADMTPVAVDALAAPLQWKRPFKSLDGKIVRLEFSWRNADLFAVDAR